MDPHDGSKKKKKKKKKGAKPAAEVIESGERAEQDPPASAVQKKKKKKKKSGGDAAAPVQNKSSAAAAPKKKKKKTEAASSSTSTAEEADGSDPLALHKAIWKDDEEEVARLLSLKHVREERINALDHRGNAPLHIAAHFANITIINALLEAGANPEVLSAAGWRPLEESIATGSMECATTLMKAGHERYRQDMLAKGPEWCKKLADMPDFYLELQWDFSVLGGWVPLVSGYIPNDTYKMWKRGSQVRLDYTLTGFKGFQITRGNVSFVFTGDAQEPNGHLFVLNHDKKTKQDFCHEPGEHYGEDVKNALEYLFAHDNCSHLPLSVDEEDHEVEFRHRTGWFSSAPTKEKVHGHHATVYDTHGMQIRTLIRSDPHAKQTRIPRSLQDEELFQEHRSAMEEYFDPEAEDPFTSTGRGDGLVWQSENVKRKVRKFEGSVWLSEDYPFKMEDFLTLIEVYSPTSQALKMLQEFVTMQMPEGFPVKIQLPVFYLLTATVQFLNLEFESPDQSLFDIPEDYEQVNEAYLGNEAREMFKSVEKKSDSKGD